MNAPALSAPTTTLLRLELDAAAFATDWKHCDQVANYLSKLVSFAREDTFLYANLLSTVLNELLEVVFCRHQPKGSVVCILTRADRVDRITLAIPVTAEEHLFYRHAVAQSQSGEAREIYTRSLLGELPTDRAIGFLELATDYGARIWLDSTDCANEVRLTVDVRLEEPALACT